MARSVYKSNSFRRILIYCNSKYRNLLSYTTCFTALYICLPYIIKYCSFSMVNMPQNCNDWDSALNTCFIFLRSFNHFKLQFFILKFLLFFFIYNFFLSIFCILFYSIYLFSLCTNYIYLYPSEFTCKSYILSISSNC